MIYVSSSCIKVNKIKDSVLLLAKNGFTNIELSGGSNYYPNFELDLLELKNEFKLNYLIHNYFPPPKVHFVLNLASSDKGIVLKSIDHYKRAIEMAERLGSKKYGIHAGFLINPKLKELGKGIIKQHVDNRKRAINVFCEGYNIIKNHSDFVELYIENNVISNENYQNYKINPFLLTDYRSYLELNEKIDFNLLLDFAHLKVSCKTLGLDFNDQLNKLIKISNYYHLSENSGLADTNDKITNKSEIYNYLKTISLNDVIVTLEVYESLNGIFESHNQIVNCFNIIYESS